MRKDWRANPWEQTMSIDRVRPSVHDLPEKRGLVRLHTALRIGLLDILGLERVHGNVDSLANESRLLKPLEVLKTHRNALDHLRVLPCDANTARPALVEPGRDHGN